MLKRSTSTLTVAAIIGTSLVATAVQLFVGAGAASASCPPDSSYYWKKSTVSYTTIGAAAGEHNSGSSAVTLDYSESTSTSASTTVSAGASFSVDAGIASVKADLSVSVTKSFTSGKTVTSHLSIPGHDYGYLQPKAEMTKFIYYRSSTTPQCGSTTTNLGTLTGITAVPFFASCVATTSCTPKP
jgi:hypothetical protein